jgi:hypothetical protein
MALGYHDRGFRKSGQAKQSKEHGGMSNINRRGFRGFEVSHSKLPEDRPFWACSRYDTSYP